MYCYKLVVAYEGTAYSGWQIQSNALTIQGIIKNVLKVLLRREDVTLIGSGRTDAGVHALGQVAHFQHDQMLDLYRFLISLNGLLPKDIRVKSIESAPEGFHAQYSAVGKEYHYQLYLERIMDPFHRLHSWHVIPKLDLDLMKQAATLFEGTHDFTSFANESCSGSAARDPVRTLYRLDIKPTEGGVRLEFEGNGFLYRMVRNIVGALVAVASGRIGIEEIDPIFKTRDRSKAPKSAPAQGLFLVRVDYTTF
jgi:tRNA pseudouridine38-40 synthase